MLHIFPDDEHVHDHGGETRGELAPLDASYEIAIDDEPDGKAGPVHEGDGLPLPDVPGDRLPIIPSHLLTITGIRSAALRHSGRVCHACAFHGVRSPAYLAAMAWYALIGIGRVIAWQGRWWWVAEATAARRMALESGEVGKWLDVHKHTLTARRNRGLILFGELAILITGGALLGLMVPWWGWAAAVAAAVPFLAWAGKPSGKPIVTPATTTPRFRLLSADIVLRAYYAAKLGDPDKAGQRITFAPPGMARDGDGSRVLVDLPYGKGLDDAIKNRGAIASGLDVSLSQVFIHRDPTSHRRHVLWVADRDPLAVPVGRTPLLSCHQTDIWNPAPLGLDERGKLATLPLMWNSVLVSALPRTAKGVRRADVEDAVRSR
jgi:hypothetical protein